MQGILLTFQTGKDKVRHETYFGVTLYWQKQTGLSGLMTVTMQKHWVMWHSRHSTMYAWLTGVRWHVVSRHWYWHIDTYLKHGNYITNIRLSVKPSTARSVTDARMFDGLFSPCEGDMQKSVNSVGSDMFQRSLFVGFVHAHILHTIIYKHKYITNIKER